jgi:hypothetical protein
MDTTDPLDRPNAPVPRHTFRRRDRLERSKIGLTVALLLLVTPLAWWAVGRGDAAAPGPVAHAHAAWEHQCAACHRPASPVSEAAALGRLLGRARDADALCQGCHAGPAHHPDAELAADVPACAACHPDHRGRAAALTRSDDRHCTACHAAPAGHHQDGAVIRVPAVADWGDHPEFHVHRNRGGDPGWLKFSHRRHLTPGLRLTKAGDPFTLRDVEEPYRERYRRGRDQPASAEVRLECADCHRTDGDDPPATDAQLAGVPLAAARPARAAGALMQPVVYENHCAGCHPLRATLPGARAGTTETLAVPHRWPPARLREFLEGRLAGAAARPDLPDRPVRPGQPPDADGGTPRQRAQSRVAAAERDLYASDKGCVLCHDFTPPPETVAPGQWQKLAVIPTQVPDVWLEGARFRHAPHRLLDCRACHANAYALDPDGSPNPQASAASADVLLPGIATCRDCHGPARATADGRRGGARSDCVECHTYHNGDHPRQGKGAAARAPALKRSLHDFLNATP